MSCNPKFKINVISRKLVTAVLCAHIQPFDIETATQEKDQIDTKIEGYVDLSWRFENNSKETHTTRFLVPTCSNPPYDAVLGKIDAEYYGMLGS